MTRDEIKVSIEAAFDQVRLADERVTRAWSRLTDAQASRDARLRDLIRAVVEGSR